MHDANMSPSTGSNTPNIQRHRSIIAPLHLYIPTDGGEIEPPNTRLPSVSYHGDNWPECSIEHKRMFPKRHLLI